MSQRNYNVSRLLSESAGQTPTKTATISADGRSVDFQQLETETARLAAFFANSGITRGMKVAAFIRPGLDFVPTIFGLFRVGAVPVFVDPGMKPKNILACLQEVAPQALVGVPLAHALRQLFRKTFRSVRIAILVGAKSPGNRLLCRRIAAPVKPGVVAAGELQQSGVVLGADDPAAIIFTSGSTGVPKGVELTHGIFDGQQQILRESFAIAADEVDLVPFPLFALFSAAWGITSIIPAMNPARPAQANGAKLADLVGKYGVTHSAGSPAIWRRLMDHCLQHGIKLPTIRRILMAGAPVPEKILNDASQVLAAGGRIFTPYGATEALPLTSIGSDELLSSCIALTRAGKGTCVGRPLPGVKLRIIKIQDDPIGDWSEAEVLPDGQVGEVVAQGALVTRSYFNRPESNRLAKIPDTDPQSPGFWHRMGDLGYFDAEGRLWFCGRKDHRVTAAAGELYPVQCEGIFNHHPAVQRTAVVGVKNRQGIEEPILVVESADSAAATLEAELIALAKDHPLTAQIKQVIFKKGFPVDVRHNIKIDRPALAKYAAAQVER